MVSQTNLNFTCKVCQVCKFETAEELTNHEKDCDGLYKEVFTCDVCRVAKISTIEEAIERENNCRVGSSMDFTYNQYMSRKFEVFKASQTFHLLSELKHSLFSLNCDKQKESSLPSTEQEEVNPKTLRPGKGTTTSASPAPAEVEEAQATSKKNANSGKIPPPSFVSTTSPTDSM